MHEIINSRPQQYSLGIALFLILLCSPLNPAQAQSTEVSSGQKEEIPPQTEVSTSDRDLKRIKKKLTDMEGRANAYDAGIGELSLEIGNLLAAKGDNEEALSAFRRALHVSRVNYGLDSVLQLPVLDAMLKVQTNANQIESAGDTLRRMYLVHKQNYPADDPATLEILIRIGVWHFSAYYFQIDNAKLTHLLEARRAFGLAHDSYLEAEQQYNFDLYNLLAMTDHGLAIVANTAESANSSDSKNSAGPNQVMASMVSGSYRRGKLLLATGIEEADKTGDLESLVRATLLYADWNQMFNKRQTARKLYVKAYQIAQDLPEKNPVRTSFNYPHRLPDFNGAALEFGPQEIETQLVPVRFDVDDWGASTNIEILPPKEDEKMSHTVKRAARGTVRSAAYRPAMVDGQPIDTKGVTQTVIVEL